MLYGPMKNGAAHRPLPSSTNGRQGSRWPGAPVAPPLSASGSRTTRRRDGSCRIRSSCARRESIVPPLIPPRSRRTHSVVSVSPPAPSACAARCSRWTPRSEGTESNPQETTIRAPVPRAVPCTRSIASRTKSTSPVRSA
ncbi:hypothetical protein [Ornithinimicrobium kibberense]|uniref:hypothetical protein n=1 Tax=Ornithinimicrobium kibberense TaxID=282060 RepID=UPI00361A8E69